MTYLPDFDLDLSQGEETETFLQQLILNKGGRVEVKLDRRWSETQNLYVETSHLVRGASHFQPSGLEVSKAEWWFFSLNNHGFLGVPTEFLRTSAAEGPKKECLSGDNPTKGWLLQDALKKLWLWQPSKLEEEE